MSDKEYGQAFFEMVAESCLYTPQIQAGLDERESTPTLAGADPTDEKSSMVDAVVTKLDSSNLRSRVISDDNPSWGLSELSNRFTDDVVKVIEDLAKGIVHGATSADKSEAEDGIRSLFNGVYDYLLALRGRHSLREIARIGPEQMDLLCTRVRNDISIIRARFEARMAIALFGEDSSKSN